MKTILILCSWSSGSTAVAGFLDRCGGHTCPPHFSTSDPKTPNPYESLALRNALHEFIDIETPQFQQKSSEEAFEQFFCKWIDEQKHLAKNIGKTFLVLKHPLKIFALHIIERYVDARFLVVRRPFEEIEQTCIRRKWPDVYGQKGASIIYEKIDDYLKDKQNFLSINYDDFLRKETQREKIMKYFELSPSDEQRKTANDWLIK
tara:strand:- start:35 stop:646 length:612 start_codon:yes stop_codon:yes gene_type:complete